MPCPISVQPIGGWSHFRRRSVIRLHVSLAASHLRVFPGKEIRKGELAMHLKKLNASAPSVSDRPLAKAKETFGRIDVFNNAGYAVAGELEGVPDEPARAMFKVNS
ncbi:hypothetical protein LXA43DRAFT_1100082 [Ganoderma leucocontextum]|nr:hypothetical protein LXA43DRAFT_1100082 [Ganoderma leucocontextum]